MMVLKWLAKMTRQKRHPRINLPTKETKQRRVLLMMIHPSWTKILLQESFCQLNHLNCGVCCLQWWYASYEVKNQPVDIVAFLLSFQIQSVYASTTFCFLLCWAFLNFYYFQHTFPRTLEGLVLNMLGPVGAEILTRKFDEMDQQTTKEEQSVLSPVSRGPHFKSFLNCLLVWCRAKFYKIFYSVFEDHYAAMDVLLNGKELFSFQVLTH